MAVLSPITPNVVNWKFTKGRYTVSDFGVFRDNWFYLVILEGHGGKSDRFKDDRGHTQAMIMLNTGETPLDSAKEISEEGLEWIQLDGEDPTKVSVHCDGYVLVNRLTSSLYMVCTNEKFMGWGLHLDGTGKWQAIKKKEPVENSAFINYVSSHTKDMLFAYERGHTGVVSMNVHLTANRKVNYFWLLQALVKLDKKF